MQLKIQLPMDYPLKGVTVDVGQQMKISARQKNKWALAIRNLLQIRNGDIISAVLLWKSNIDKELTELFVGICFVFPCISGAKLSNLIKGCNNLETIIGIPTKHIIYTLTNV